MSVTELQKPVAGLYTVAVVTAFELEVPVVPPTTRTRPSWSSALAAAHRACESGAVGDHEPSP
jgi:hypothetical protein